MQCSLLYCYQRFLRSYSLISRGRWNMKNEETTSSSKLHRIRYQKSVNPINWGYVCRGSWGERRGKWQGSAENCLLDSFTICAQTSFNKEKNLFTSKLDLRLTSKVLYLDHRFYGADIWTLQKVDQKTLWQFWNVVLGMEREDQLHRSCEKWRSYGGKYVTSCVRTAFYSTLLTDR